MSAIVVSGKERGERGDGMGGERGKRRKERGQTYIGRPDTREENLENREARDRVETRKQREDALEKRKEIEQERRANIIFIY